MFTYFDWLHRVIVAIFCAMWYRKNLHMWTNVLVLTRKDGFVACVASSYVHTMDGSGNHRDITNTKLDRHPQASTGLERQKTTTTTPTATVTATATPTPTLTTTTRTTTTAATTKHNNNNNNHNNHNNNKPQQ